MFRKQDTKIHLVGIGGMGMCGIAEVLINLGYKVTGSDVRETEITRHLATIGGKVFLSHRAENVGDADVVVVSSAIKGENPEIDAARAHGVPVIQRAEMLGELMRMKYSIAVAGSHGKTTTTTMVATVLMAAGLDPTAVIGGRVNSLGLANARLGQGEYLVAEADESDGSFLKLPPTVAVVTNIDAEHLDHYGTHENVKKAFVDFVNRVPFYGLAVLCLDHPHVQSIIPKVQKRHVTYGEAPQADYRARDIRFDGFRTSYVASRRGEELGTVTIGMPGRHNVANSLATLAVADFLGVSFELARNALASFQGVQRRFTVRGDLGGVMVVDDFGHHPMEVRATLSGARAGFPGRRIVAAFQPHRFTRTRDQFGELARSFYDADAVVICDVFPAGEPPIPGVESGKLVQAVRDHGHKDVTYIPRREDIAPHLAESARPGDIVITLGAGDIQLTCNELLSVLSTRKAAEAK
ncbi:MAG: UDP-N-acetylmuramate--L-alanine ligase [Deltaproteobacteria bacterium]|nr:UDP-N-acetylmuramate--L-alanine ligase [Deltaproteobacteria bacterium]